MWWFMFTLPFCLWCASSPGRASTNLRETVWGAESQGCSQFFVQLPAGSLAGPWPQFSVVNGAVTFGLLGSPLPTQKRTGAWTLGADLPAGNPAATPGSRLPIPHWELGYHPGLLSSLHFAELFSILRTRFLGRSKSSSPNCTASFYCLFVANLILLFLRGEWDGILISFAPYCETPSASVELQRWK